MVVVNGSAEQLNQTLASLAALPGVAIVPARRNWRRFTLDFCSRAWNLSRRVNRSRS